MKSFTVESDESTVFHLYSLKEYEADGGEYCDTGNGGEDMSDQRETFVAAMQGPTDYDATGLTADDVWYDSVSGYWLIRRWPPAAARLAPFD